METDTYVRHTDKKNTRMRYTDRKNTYMRYTDRNNTYMRRTDTTVYFSYINRGFNCFYCKIMLYGIKCAYYSVLTAKAT